ncbi:MAG: hypothetical protein IPM69_19410 [Ignavibacteria bacterium]|nr:hypothetical protein [Ignavibacteria bacterium]
MDIILHHESKDWKLEIEELSVELSALFDERDYLKNVLLPNIEREYLCELGELELRKFILMVEIKKTKYMTELIQAYINRREIPDFDIIHHTIFEEFKAWEFEMGERAASIDRARNESKMARFATHEETIKCRKLFREIVKKLHPDVIGEHTEAQKFSGCRRNMLIQFAILMNSDQLL